MSIIHTKYRHLTTDELLNRYEESARKSPVIQELCNRITVLQEQVERSKTSICNVCEAPIQIEEVQDNDN